MIKSINPSDIPLRERHQTIIGAVGPRPIAWASTVNENGDINLAPYSFFNSFSANPPLLIFSSNRRGRDNTTKDTLANIEQTKEVVINVVNYGLVHQMNISSTDYESGVNEFMKSGVTMIDSQIVKPPRVKESPVQFECKVNDIIYTGKEGGAANLFLCEIVMIHIDETILNEEGHIDPHKLKLVGRMGKSFYTKAFGDSVFEINNPFDVENIGFDQLPDHIKKSEVLTGNDIAKLAMQTIFPTEEELDAISNSFLEKSPGEKHQIAKTLIDQGNLRDAFALLMKSN